MCGYITFFYIQPKEPVPKREKKRKVQSKMLVVCFVQACMEHFSLHGNQPTLPQFAPVVGDTGAERQKSLDLLTKLTKKKEVLDVKKATNAHLAAEQAKYISTVNFDLCTCSTVCPLNFDLLCTCYST